MSDDGQCGKHHRADNHGIDDDDSLPRCAVNAQFTDELVTVHLGLRWGDGNALSLFRWKIKHAPMDGTPWARALCCCGLARTRAVGSSDDSHRREDKRSDNHAVNNQYRRESGTMHTQFAVQFVAGHDRPPVC